MKSTASIAVIVKPAASIPVTVKSAAIIDVTVKSSSDVCMNNPCTAIKSASTVFYIDIITLFKVHL